MKELFYVSIGGGIGSAIRYIVSLLWKHSIHVSILPWQTLIVNIVGCFLIGLFYQYSEKWGLTPEIRLLLTTGFCGGLTTFSTFSYEGIEMLRNGFIAYYALYVVLSIVIGLLALWLAIKLA
ncbi:MAG: fluoride efflux transporter CrcB [Prevotellaceae bacterium]|nr:fluoride efflux transporter CrcB [Candidatus Faecinaster equi]